MMIDIMSSMSGSSKDNWEIITDGKGRRKEQIFVAFINRELGAYKNRHKDRKHLQKGNEEKSIKSA